MFEKIKICVQNITFNNIQVKTNLNIYLKLKLISRVLILLILALLDNEWRFKHTFIIVQRMYIRL